nr:MAG TPA: hypothetical protein [Caudoviricetes sp.]
MKAISMRVLIDLNTTFKLRCESQRNLERRLN